MTIAEGFAQFAASNEFKEISKRKDSEGGKLRSYLSRYNKGVLKTGAMVELLLANGYEVKANKVIKKTQTKAAK